MEKEYTLENNINNHTIKYYVQRTVLSIRVLFLLNIYNKK